MLQEQDAQSVMLKHGKHSQGYRFMTIILCGLMTKFEIKYRVTMKPLLKREVNTSDTWRKRAISKLTAEYSRCNKVDVFFENQVGGVYGK